jgi:uncharacterized protein (DUF885 family)
MVEAVMRVTGLVGGVMCVVLAIPPARAQAQAVPVPTLATVLATIERCQGASDLERMAISGRPLTELPDVTRATWEQTAACWRTVAADAARISSASLTTQERLTVRVVQWEAAMQQQRAPHWWVDFSSVTPYSSPIGASARAIGALPLATAADTSAVLHLLRAAPRLLTDIRAGLEQRAARGIRLARDAVPGAAGLASAYAVRGLANPFMIANSKLVLLDSATRAAFQRSAQTIVDSAIAPAADRLVALLNGPYADQAPARVGLSQYPGGAAYYEWLVRWHTTLPTTPTLVHRTGVAEVARIEREMAALRQQMGFTGTRAEFHLQLAHDPKLFAATPEAFGERLQSYATRLNPLLDQAFLRRPRALGDVRRLSPELEPYMTFGFYQVPSRTDSVGHYFYNGTKLNERSLLTAAPLIAHELWPGHHFQTNLANESGALPTYRKGYYTAYGEGWGDYASIVAGELGLYSDPIDRYGRLAMDMFISCRLVVDTGMNALGWSRERAMQYMRDHVLESEVQIRSESLRYSTDLPGQALAYKMGSNEFVRLRQVAALSLGAKFDVRRFHDLVLSNGSLPMSVLGDEVATWVRQQR